MNETNLTEIFIDVTKNKYCKTINMKNNKVGKKIITNEDKLNYIKYFISTNLKKINLIQKIEEFELELSDESEDEIIMDNNLSIE